MALRFQQSAKRTFEDSRRYAKEHKHEYLTPEHILRTILDQHPGIYENVDEKVIIKSLDEYLDTYISKVEKEPIESADFHGMANRAAQCTMNAGKDEIESADILAGIWNTKCQASMILKAYKITKDDTISAARKLKEPTKFDSNGTFCKDIGSLLMLLGWAIYNGNQEVK
ncbi:hypothetical protein FACS1894110_17060 [Spirochaetia bacterium]|nr:hypothetical protein FACS1894110_17060 [Spirochaetia bacterium]